MIDKHVFLVWTAFLSLLCPRPGLAADAASKAAAPEIPVSDFARSLEYAGVAVQEPGYHVWGSSPLIDTHGKVHLFVSRWPIIRPFDHGWRHDSEIAHYIGEGPEGPFEFSDVALRGTGEDTWDRYAPCNSLIQEVDGQFVLLYVANPVGVSRGMGAHSRTQRIGMATSTSLDGPWERVGQDGLILSPSDDPKHWTHRVQVVNPAFLKHPSGKYLLYFKSRGARMGVAIAEKLEGPYVHQPRPLSDNEQRVSGFADIVLYPEGGNIDVRVMRNGEQLPPIDYFSQSQQQILILSLFLTACTTQTWSAFPPILLDDPVTHFDDLNAYAFLDQIAGFLDTGMQIRKFIISTCDERLFQLARQRFQDFGDRKKFYRFVSVGRDGPVIESM
jgi:hypothetical protein